MKHGGWFVLRVVIYTALGLGGIAAGALWQEYGLGFWLLCSSMTWETIFGQATLRDLLRAERQ